MSARLPRRNQQAREIADELGRHLAPGDVLFTRLTNPLGNRIADASASWTSHVGVAFTDARGSWRVLESKIPISRESSLEDFLRRSENGSVSAKRLIGGMRPDEAVALEQAARRRLGRVYHTGFDYSGFGQFCSKFVHDAYREALGVDLGCVETFSELLARNPDSPVAFWRAWYFGRIPWRRNTVTPASLYASPRLATIYERLDFVPRRAAMPARQSSMSSSHSAE